MKSIVLVWFIAISFLISVPLNVVEAQNITTLFSFNQNGQNGQQPWGGVILSGNQLFGTTYYGGPQGAGTVFSINTDGTAFQTLAAFNQYGSPVGYPLSGLTQVGSTLFGTTSGRQPGTTGGGPKGAIYSINTDGTGFKILQGLNGTAGSEPNTKLVASGSQLFGTAPYGGANYSQGQNRGTVFSINMDGSGLNNLNSFTYTPYSAYPTDLTLIGSTLYGTTGRGGTSNSGTSFSINTDGTGFKTLYSFDGSANGGIPWTGLTRSGNKFFGTTSQGGTNGTGTVFSVNIDGSGFQTLFSFTGNSGQYPGAMPDSDLVLSGTKLYGSTQMGGTDNFGTVFCLNTDGTGFQSLASFNGNNGYTPTGNLVVSGSMLYGTTVGGNGSSGTVYSLSVPVPEPGITTLLLCGVLCIWTRWRFKK